MKWRKRWNRHEWLPYFSWHPVLLNDNRTWVWLEWVQRRIVTVGGYNDSWYVSEYKQ